MTSGGNKLRRENVATTPRTKVKSNFVKSDANFDVDFKAKEYTEGVDSPP